MRIHRDERGQAIILVALSLPIMLGFVGLATDVGSLLNDKRQLQTAADAAAIAGALSLSSSILNTSNAFITAAQNAAATNGFAVGPGVAVTVNNPPTWPASNYNGAVNNGGQGYVEVTITKSEPTIFLALFGHPSVTVLARAVATNSGPPAACIYTVGDGVTAPGSGPGLTVTSSMQSLAPACGLVVDSNASPPMNIAASLTMSTIGTVGNCGPGGSDCGSGSISPTPVSNIIPYSDPLSYLPQFTCNSGTCSNGTTSYTCGTAKLSQPLLPGCYNGITASGSAINLQSGMYVINGPLNLAGGTLTGANVTIFMAGTTGAITLAGTSLNLSAPTSGTYNGILFAQSSADTNAATINANPASSVQGFFYFPNSALLLDSTFTSAYTGFVAQSITVNSVGSFSFNNYASLPGVTSPIASVVLVE